MIDRCLLAIALVVIIPFLLWFLAGVLCAPILSSRISRDEGSQDE